MNKPADLIAYIFDSKSHRLRNELADWMEASPRLTSFVETYRDKIRKKIRVAQGPDSLLDVFKNRLPKVKCFRPEATYIMWMDFREYGLSAEEIHDRIYNKANVLLEGGQMFDPFNGAGFERICVPTQRALLMKAMNRIADQFQD